jgi:hypothetical protein
MRGERMVVERGREEEGGGRRRGRERTDSEGVRIEMKVKTQDKYM